MFTGIVTHLGTIIAITESIEVKQLKIAVSNDPLFWEDVQLGDSIAVMGCCLTVVSRERDMASFDVSSETLRCTLLGQLKVGNKVHLEKSLRLSDRLHGHLMLGHVDGLVTLIERTSEGSAIKLTFKAPREFMKYIVRKGTVALNGVSLTVNHAEKERFSVMIIPHTQLKTLLQTLEINQTVNLEIDMLARYAEARDV